MANFKAWKERTATLRKKIVSKARAFSWKSRTVTKNDEQIETMDTFDDLPLLRAVPKKVIMNASNCICCETIQGHFVLELQHQALIVPATLYEK